MLRVRWHSHAHTQCACQASAPEANPSSIPRNHVPHVGPLNLDEHRGEEARNHEVQRIVGHDLSASLVSNRLQDSVFWRRRALCQKKSSGLASFFSSALRSPSFVEVYADTCHRKAWPKRLQDNPETDFADTVRGCGIPGNHEEASNQHVLLRQQLQRRQILRSEPGQLCCVCRLALALWAQALPSEMSDHDGEDEGKPTAVNAINARL